MFALAFMCCIHGTKTDASICNEYSIKIIARRTVFSLYLITLYITKTNTNHTNYFIRLLLCKKDIFTLINLVICLH